jgi:hypothetical protein
MELKKQNVFATTRTSRRLLLINNKLFRLAKRSLDSAVRMDSCRNPERAEPLHQTAVLYALKDMSSPR